MFSKLFNVFEIENKNFLENGKCGLQNMGNTCFLNSILQCLRHNKYLTVFFTSGEYVKYLNKSQDIYSIMCAITAQLLKDFWEHNNIIIQPVGFIRNFHNITKILKKHSFSSYNQNDAGEFLQIILDVLNEALKVKIPNNFLKISGTVKNDTDKIQKNFYEYFFKHISTEGTSAISKIYSGFYMSTIVTNNNEITSTNFEPFFYVNLEINDKNTFVYCTRINVKTNCLNVF